MITSGSGTLGIDAQGGGTANLLDVAVSTTGSDASALVAEGSGSMASLTGANGFTTAGDGSIGLFAAGGGIINVTGPTAITTGSTSAMTGLGAYGVNADGAGSQVNLNAAATVTTNWTNAYGLYATNGGAIDAPDGPIVITSGTGAIGVYASGAAPSPGAPSTITIGSASSGGSVTTLGDGAIGLYATGGGIINDNGPTAITTGSTSAMTGLGAYGVNADGAGSQVNLNAATTVTTNWTNAYGLYATNGGAVDAPDGPIVVTRGTGAIGVYASGAASTIFTSGASITTNGGSATGVQADGGGAATINGGSVTTNGAGSSGVVASGGGSTAKLGGASVIDITTAGDGAIGLHAAGGGVIDSTAPTAITTGSTSAMTGLGAYGVNADGAGSQVNLNAAATVTTNWTNAYGLYASNGGAIDAPDGPRVMTSGASVIGVYASGPASTISVGSASITTNGGSATAVQADGGGAVTMNGGSVATNGADAPAVVASGGGSKVTVTGASMVSTIGIGSIGLYALGGGVIDALGQTTIVTSGTASTSTGPGAYGVNADGAGSQVNLAAATITTGGQGAAGLYASDVTGTGHGGAITVSGPLGVTTGTASAAYGAWAQSAGSTIALNGPSTFTINGGAFALYAAQGGAISTGSTLGVTVNGGASAGGVEANGSGSSATLKGATTIALNGNQNAGLLAAAGGAISVQDPASIAVSGAQSVGVQATSGKVTASAALNVTTSQATSAAFALSGASPSIVATGGGTVSAAGNAINFINTANAVATFDNFNIASATGDLIFAEPSVATVNFTNTTANASGGNLLNATLGSAVALNANASTLTGAIQTDATSTTNVSLTNGTTWTMTGTSAMTGLNVFNSAVVFSSSGGFKTLTVGSLVGGTGANVTLNTALGAATPATDQIIINGGSATGLTSLTIKNASGNAGAPTTGAGIPVVVVTNGGTTSASAFQLASNTPVIAGGYEYTLGRGGNEDWYLTSSPSASVNQIRSSVTSLAQSQLNNLVTGRLLGSLLLGANEQINSCSCGGGFASIGSFALGSHGRWALNDNVTLLAGASFDQYYQDGTNVRAAPIVAASLRYDPATWGESRPFFELGSSLSPYIAATYTRYYDNGFTPATGVGSAVDRAISVFGRVGWVARFTPIDEGAVFADLVRSWVQSGGYTEGASSINPFPATVSNGVSREDVVRVGAQYTHLLFGNLEANINGAIAYGFDNKFGSQVSVVDFGSIAPYPLLNSAWTEFGGRLAYRLSRNLVADAFVIGTLGGEVGATLHLGLGVRYAF